MRNQTVNLNLIPGGVSPVVHLSQFDQDADGSLIFNIYNGVVPYDLTDCVAHIQGHKPDDTIFDYECTVYATYVTAPTEYQMTVMAGQYPVELRISKDGSSVGTANMIFSVEPSTGTGADLSHTDIPELVLQIEQAVVSSGASASAAEDSAEDAEAWAVGQINGTDVPNTDPRYHNNSKYYADEASSSATAAGTSETNAATSEDNAEAWATGQKNGSDVPSGDPAYHNNSKYYSEQADDSAEDAEAWAVGERDGVPVTSDDPTYHNNSKYWSQQSAHASVATLTDVTLTSLADGDLLQYDSDSQDWLNVPQSSITPADMTGATSGAAGARGLVPAPAQGDQDKVLTGGGTWADMEDSKAYHTDDTAETTLNDADYVPFYDTSASGKRKSLWSNIKSVLKTYFDTLYTAKTTSKGSTTKGVYFDSNGAVKEMTYSVEKSVPSDAVFSDVAVRQTDTSANSDYRVLFSSTANDTTETAGTRKSTNLKFNPSTGNLSVQKINGYPTTPDYVDAQYNNSTTYSKGMTCIEGNVRYRYKNSTATSGHRPPDATYWEVYSMASEISEQATLIASYAGTTSSSDSMQILPTQRIQTSLASIKANYRYILLVLHNYSSVMSVNDGYLVESSSIYPLSIVDIPSGNNCAYMLHTGYHTVANANDVLIVTFQDTHMEVDYQIRTSEATTYKAKWAIYGIN